MRCRDNKRGRYMYMTTRGAIQGCPLGMLAFCVSYTKSASWIKETMAAAGRGEGGLPTYTHEPPTHITGRMQAWLTTHRVGQPTPSTANVVTRHYADNGVFGAVPELVRGNQVPKIQTAVGGIQ